jgi:hypothetical protein
MYKKASKELKEQLEALGENKDEKIKMLHTKLLEKIHECNKLDRNIASQQVPVASSSHMLSVPLYLCARTHAPNKGDRNRERERERERERKRKRER